MLGPPLETLSLMTNLCHSYNTRPTTYMQFTFRSTKVACWYSTHKKNPLCITWRYLLLSWEQTHGNILFLRLSGIIKAKTKRKREKPSVCLPDFIRPNCFLCLSNPTDVKCLGKSTHHLIRRHVCVCDCQSLAACVYKHTLGLLLGCCCVSKRSQQQGRALL